MSKKPYKNLEKSEFNPKFKFKEAPWH